MTDEERPPKCWRTVVTIEILTRDEEPPAFESIEDVNYAITEGHASGDWNAESHEVTEAEMRKLLVAQRSDESFLFPEDEDAEDSK